MSNGKLLGWPFYSTTNIPLTLTVGLSQSRSYTPTQFSSQHLSLPLDRGSVKLGPLAEEKARGLPFGAALDFRAGENIDDPLRCAILTTIAVSFETNSSSLKVA